MTDNRDLLKLIPEQREDLQRWAQSRTLPAGDVFRARLILALADGTTYRQIARSLKTSLPTVARWKMRFERDGLAGLEGRHQGSKPRAATPKVQARVIRRAQQKPADGSTHWSCRKLAQELVCGDDMAIIRDTFSLSLVRVLGKSYFSSLRSACAASRQEPLRAPPACRSGKSSLRIPWLQEGERTGRAQTRHETEKAQTPSVDIRCRDGAERHPGN